MFGEHLTAVVYNSKNVDGLLSPLSSLLNWKVTEM
jgi:hypothetical protein